MLKKYSPEKNPIAIKCKGADNLPLDSIVKFQGDLKKLTDENRDKLIGSICKKGFISPLFIWQFKGNNNLLDGTQRTTTLIYMREKGWNIPLIPVVYIKAKSEKDAREILLAITSQFGEFNTDILDEWVSEMDSDIAETLRIVDTEVDLAIASLSDSDDETDGDDEVDDSMLGEEPLTQLGDLWEFTVEDRTHRLLCGDSTSKESISTLTNDERPHMVFTDPPYNVAFNGRSGKFNVILNDDLPEKEFNNFILEWIKRLEESKISTYYICCNWAFYGIMSEILKPKACIVWAKNVFGLGRGYRHQHEFILFDGMIDPEIKNESDLWQIAKDSKYVHPTQKPTALSERAIQNSTSVGDLVIDYYGGSGSTLLGCEKTKRIARLMELDPHYCDVIAHRFSSWCKKNDRDCTIKLNGEVVNISDLSISENREKNEKK